MALTLQVTVRAAKLGMFFLGACASSGGGSAQGAAEAPGAASEVGSEAGPKAGSETQGDGVSTPVEAPQAAASDSDGAMPEAWTQCTTDAECQLLEVGCCDHCNGGDAIAVNRDHAQDARRWHAARRTCPSPTLCTERGCYGPFPTCSAGRCELKAP